MRRSILGVVVVVAVAVVLGATVFREEIASAAATLNVLVTNDTSIPVPVRARGAVQVTASTPLAVDAGLETQLLVDQVVHDNDRVTIPVEAYETIHVDGSSTRSSTTTTG